VPVSPSDEPLIRGAYRGALVAAVLNALGTPFEIAIAASVPHFPRWPPIASSAVGVVVAIALWVGRRRMSVRLASLAFIVNNAVIIAALWLTNPAFATTGQCWLPFQANKLGSLAAAILAPEIWSGIVVVSGFAGSGILQTLLLPPQVRAGLEHATVLTLFVWGGFGFAVLVLQLRRQHMQVFLVNARVQRRALEQLAERLMAIRELTNTPLQTIEFCTALIRRRYPMAGDELDYMERAVKSLRELGDILSELEANERWSLEHEALDARATLSRPVANLRRPSERPS
jgi:hypothetical protein